MVVRRAIRLASVAGVAALMVLALISPASAGPPAAPFDDPDEPAIDVLDIATVTHDDTEEAITYTLTFHDATDWDPAALDTDFIVWGLNVDDDEEGDLCVAVFGDTPDVIVDTCEGFDPEDPLATGEATVEDGELTVEWPRSAFAEAGLGPFEDYDYLVVTAEDATVFDPFTEPDPDTYDIAPDLPADEEADQEFYNHELTAAQPAPPTTTTTVAETTTTTAAVTTTTLASVANLSTAAPATPVSANPSYTG
jgi:hypothetical protein